MSKGPKSSPQLAASDSAGQPSAALMTSARVAADASLLVRLRFTLAAAVDIVTLAEAIGAAARTLAEQNAEAHEPLAAEVLADRISTMANAICAVLDDPEGTNLDEKINEVFKRGMGAYTCEAARYLVPNADQAAEVAP